MVLEIVAVKLKGQQRIFVQQKMFLGIFLIAVAYFKTFVCMKTGIGQGLGIAAVLRVVTLDSGGNGGHLAAGFALVVPVHAENENNGGRPSNQPEAFNPFRLRVAPYLPPFHGTGNQQQRQENQQHKAEHLHGEKPNGQTDAD